MRYELRRVKDDEKKKSDSPSQISLLQSKRIPVESLCFHTKHYTSKVVINMYTLKKKGPTDGGLTCRSVGVPAPPLEFDSTGLALTESGGAASILSFPLLFGVDPARHEEVSKAIRCCFFYIY